MMDQIPFSFDSAWQARQSFFGDDPSAGHEVPREVLNSWTRCRNIGVDTHEKLAFEPVYDNATQALGECNRAFVAAAAHPLEVLGAATCDTGYAALLTDLLGNSLMVSGDVRGHGTLLKRALRVGVNLSEPAIGTSAMVAAIHERRAARVFGPEHFCLEMQSIFCAAAPVFDANGNVIGAVDISSDSAPPAFDALALVSDAALVIQRSLLRSIPRVTILRLHWDDRLADQGAMIAVGPDSEIVGMDENARSLLGLRNRRGPLGFANVFDRMFAEVADMVLKGRVVALRRLGGLQFLVRLDEESSARLVVRRMPAKANAANMDVASLRAITALEMSLNDDEASALKNVETRAIIDALHACSGNISAAARRLGISRATIHRRLCREN